MTNVDAVRLPNPEGAHAPLERILAWSPDGSLLVLDDRSTTGPYLVDVEHWRVGHRLGPTDYVRFSPDGRRLAYAPRGRKFGVHVLDLEAMDAPRVLELRLPAAAIAFSADGTRLLTSDGWHTTVYDIRDEPVVEVQLEHCGGVAARDEDNHDLALRGTDLIDLAFSMGRLEEAVHVWDTSTESPEPRTIALEKLPLGQTVLVQDGSALLRTWVRDRAEALRGSTGTHLRLDVLELPSGRLLRSVPLPGRGYVHSIAATPDGATVVVDVGPANGQQQLLWLKDPIAATSTPRTLGEVDWIIAFLSVCPRGRTVLFNKGDSLWRLELPRPLSVVR